MEVTTVHLQISEAQHSLHPHQQLAEAQHHLRLHQQLAKVDVANIIVS